jgi:hypothetical protein
MREDLVFVWYRCGLDVDGILKNCFIAAKRNEGKGAKKRTENENIGQKING